VPESTAPAANDAALRRVKRVLVAVLVLLGAHLALGDNPWSEDVWNRLGDVVQVPPRLAMPFVWFASLGNLLLVAAALLTLRYWCRFEPAPERPELAAGAPAGRAFRVAVLGSMLVCVLLAAPRMSHGLWGDESYAAVNSIVGKYDRNSEGEIRYARTKWRDAFWAYRMPNNHVPFTLAARLSSKAWTAIAKPKERLRVEPALRLPAFLAGIGAVAALATFVRRIGYPLAAVFAAWALALHPWHMRYTSEARGYSLLLLLVPLYLAATIDVLERGTWRRFAVYGAFQFFLLWTYPATVVFAVLVNAFLVYELWKRYRGTPDARPQLTRWFVAGTAGAALFLQLMTPNLVQFVGYLGKRQIGTMGVRWLQDLGAHFLIGGRYGSPGLRPLHPDLADWTSGQPLLFWAFVAALVIGIAVGAWRIGRRSGSWARFVGVLLTFGPLTYAYSAMQGAYMHWWYLLFALPVLLALLAVGVEGLAVPIRGAAPRAAVAVGLMLALLAVQGVLAQPMRQMLWEREVTPIRASIEAVRPSLDPYDPRNEQILTISVYDHAHYYDPLGYPVDDEAELRSLIDRAQREGLTAYAIWDKVGLARRRKPEVMALVEREDLFEPVVELEGADPFLTRVVVRYRGVPLPEPAPVDG
jgi:hypothetical protein